MALALLTRVADHFQAPAGSDVTISVRSASGAITLDNANYPDGTKALPVVGGNSTFTVVGGEHTLAVTGTLAYPWEDWWGVEVENGVLSPALEHGSGYDGGQFTLNITILGV